MPRIKKHKNAPTPYCIAVVAAAGSASRMRGENKQLALLGDRPVLVHALQALDRCTEVHEIIIVTREDMILPVGELCKDFSIQKATKIVPGGASRTESVLRGVLEAPERAELVAVHDGARPLITPDLVSAVVRMAAKTGAAAPALPVRDTIKIARNGLVCATPERSELFAVQTPQVFQADLLKGALRHALDSGEQPTDDCAALERMGVPVSLIEGDPMNLKITVPSDRIVAEALLEWRESE